MYGLRASISSPKIEMQAISAKHCRESKSGNIVLEIRFVRTLDRLRGGGLPTSSPVALPARLKRERG
jgi:hypothetical protein